MLVEILPALTCQPKAAQTHVVRSGVLSWHIVAVVTPLKVKFWRHHVIEANDIYMTKF